MKRFPYKTTVALAALLSVACVHEYPDDAGTDPTAIQTQITLKTQTTFTHSSILAREREDYGHMYFVVELHDEEFGDTPLLRREVGVPRTADGSATITLNETLHAGNYKCIAYAAPAQEADGSGRIFSLRDLEAISHEGEYPGSTDAKECYEIRFDLSLSADRWFDSYESTHLLESPMGSIEVISADAEEFIKLEIARLESQRQQQGGKSRADWQWSDYYVVWSFNMYHPVGYNAYTGLPNKAEQEISFRSEITPQNEQEASLGFDYVFVNGAQSQVNLTLRIYDKDDTLLNVYSGIEVPIERGKTTIVRGEYLTNRKESGIGIDPEFDGDITIVLPD